MTDWKKLVCHADGGPLLAVQGVMDARSLSQAMAEWVGEVRKISAPKMLLEAVPSRLQGATSTDNMVGTIGHQ